MLSTAIDRRWFLALTAAGVALPLLPGRAQAGRGPLYLSSYGAADGTFRLVGIRADGEAFDLPLPGRGHALAVQPGGRAATIFARRPGTFAQVLDVHGGRLVHEIEARDDRHFYGHGVYAPDGGLLYAAENDFAGQQGVIGVYDARDGYRRVAELPAHGIGLHDVTLMPDGETLVIANGGIATHPDLPRVNLNLPTMEPSLVYADRRDGTLLERIVLPRGLHMLSIRHVDVARDGLVAFAMQYEGPEGDQMPLVGLHRRGEAPFLFEGPDHVLRDMKLYCGAVAFDRRGETIAVSSPHGNVFTFWDARARRHLARIEKADGCGVAAGPAEGSFVLTSGFGGMFDVDGATGTVRRLLSPADDSRRWDNHIARLVAS